MHCIALHPIYSLLNTPSFPALPSPPWSLLQCLPLQATMKPSPIHLLGESTPRQRCRHHRCRIEWAVGGRLTRLDRDSRLKGRGRGRAKVNFPRQPPLGRQQRQTCARSRGSTSSRWTGTTPSPSSNSSFNISGSSSSQRCSTTSCCDKCR